MARHENGHGLPVDALAMAIYQQLQEDENPVPAPELAARIYGRRTPNLRSRVTMRCLYLHRAGWLDRHDITPGTRTFGGSPSRVGYTLSDAAREAL